MAANHVTSYSSSFRLLLLLLVGFISTLVVNAQNNNNVPVSTSVDKTVQLKNGRTIPVVGLGTSRIAPTAEQVTQAIKDAIEVGYRHIDTADYYQNEQAIGKALEELIRDGKITRNELFITTKVWSNHHSRELAMQSVRKSLANLRLTYLDLVLVHWPVSFQSGGDLVPKFANGTLIGSDLSKENFELAYQGLEDALDQNLTRSIGVSNFNIKQLNKLLSANRRHEPVVNQVECHPHLNQQTLLDYCQGKGIRLVAYSPLRRANQALFNEQKLIQIAAKHNRTIAQVVLRWQLQRGVIIIPRTGKKHRMIENISLFDFELNNDEMFDIKSLDRSRNNEGREIRFESAAHLPEYPF